MVTYQAEVRFSPLIGLPGARYIAWEDVVWADSLGQVFVETRRVVACSRYGDADLNLYNCITQRGIYRITMIMFNMRQKDLSSVYM